MRAVDLRNIKSRSLTRNICGKVCTDGGNVSAVDRLRKCKGGIDQMGPQEAVEDKISGQRMGR